MKEKNLPHLHRARPILVTSNTYNFLYLAIKHCYFIEQDLPFNVIHY